MLVSFPWFNLNYIYRPSSYRVVLHSVLVIKTSQLKLYREIIAVCSQIHTKHINTLCGQNVELLNVKLVVHIVITGPSKASNFDSYIVLACLFRVPSCSQGLQKWRLLRLTPVHSCKWVARALPHTHTVILPCSLRQRAPTIRQAHYCQTDRSASLLAHAQAMSVVGSAISTSMTPNFIVLAASLLSVF